MRGASSILCKKPIKLGTRRRVIVRIVRTLRDANAAMAWGSTHTAAPRDDGVETPRPPRRPALLQIEPDHSGLALARPCTSKGQPNGAN